MDSSLIDIWIRFSRVEIEDHWIISNISYNGMVVLRDESERIVLFNPHDNRFRFITKDVGHGIIRFSPDSTKIYSVTTIDNMEWTMFWDTTSLGLLYTIPGINCEFSDSCREIYATSANYFITCCAMIGDITSMIDLGINTRTSRDYPMITIRTPMCVDYGYHINVIPSLSCMVPWCMNIGLRSVITWNSSYKITTEQVDSLRYLIVLLKQ